MLNKAIIMGRMVRDPEIRNTNSGTALCRFSVAVDRSFADKQTGKREADFLDCTAFGKTAEFVCRYFSKGKMILVEGEIRNNNYTDNNGVKHYSNNIAVNSVSFCGDSANGNNNGGGNYNPAGNQQPQAAQPVNLEEFESLNSEDCPF